MYQFHIESHIFPYYINACIIIVNFRKSEKVFMYPIDINHLTVLKYPNLINYCNMRISLENAFMHTFLPYDDSERYVNTAYLKMEIRHLLFKMQNKFCN